MLVTNETNVRYLTGFTGDSTYLLLDVNGQATLLSDPRYEEQIEQQCPGLSAAIRQPSAMLADFTVEQIRARDYGRLLIEPNSLSLAVHDVLSDGLGLMEFVRGNSEVEQLRAIKDVGEIELLRRAVEIAQRAMLGLRAQWTGRETELQLAHELERIIRGLGGEGCSFAPIVAAGPQSALPHAQPSNQVSGAHGFLLVDWGATFHGYRSDLTRVLVTSKIPAKIARAYETVLAAQTAAIAAIRPGVAASEVDRVARQVISDARLGKRFTHGLGHGIGLDIHELPRLSKSSDETLREGMVVTVEPGVYHPGIGGIRIEDDVLVTRDGARVLSDLPRSLDENRVKLIDG